MKLGDILVSAYSIYTSTNVIVAHSKFLCCKVGDGIILVEESIQKREKDAQHQSLNTSWDTVGRRERDTHA